MYLVDTSVWIDAQRPVPGPKGLRLRELVDQQASFGLAPVILQEILQGCRDEAALARTRHQLALQRCFLPVDPVKTCADAGALYARCRWAGVAPRSSNDCLIAQIAIEYELTLLHDDADFERIAAVEPRLKLA